MLRAAKATCIWLSPAPFRPTGWAQRSDPKIGHRLIGAASDEERAGNIAAAITEDGARIEGDLFTDCTGFARLPIGQAMGVGVESYKDWLLCDRALAMPVSYDVRPMDEIRPYTSSTALSSGWVWDIGLRERRGVGYVYSSQYISDEDAELKPTGTSSSVG